MIFEIQMNLLYWYFVIQVPSKKKCNVACMVQAANEGKWESVQLTELHETSTVRTTVYGSNTVQVYVQSLSKVNCMTQCLLLLTVRPYNLYRKLTVWNSSSNIRSSVTWQPRYHIDQSYLSNISIQHIYSTYLSISSIYHNYLSHLSYHIYLSYKSYLSISSIYHMYLSYLSIISIYVYLHALMYIPPEF